MAALLEVEGLKAYYGQTQALHDVSFALEPGGITTLLGANGAGKTTTLCSICGMVRTQGTIKFDGKVIDKGMNAAQAGWKPGGFKSMFFGWKNFEGGINGVTEFWADDLAFGEKEIPCPTK